MKYLRRQGRGLPPPVCFILAAVVFRDERDHGFATTQQLIEDAADDALPGAVAAESPFAYVLASRVMLVECVDIAQDYVEVVLCGGQIQCSGHRQDEVVRLQDARFFCSLVRQDEFPATGEESKSGVQSRVREKRGNVVFLSITCWVFEGNWGILISILFLWLSLAFETSSGR